MWSNWNSNGNVNQYNHYGKLFGQIYYKLNIHILYNSAVLLLLIDINPTEMHDYVHQTTCSGTFIAALFIIARS